MDRVLEDVLRIPPDVPPKTRNGVAPEVAPIVSVDAPPALSINTLSVVLKLAMLRAAEEEMSVPVIVPSVISSDSIDVPNGPSGRFVRLDPSPEKAVALTVPATSSF